MHKRAALFIIVWGLVLPAVAADEWTDALLGADPHNPYDTGPGRAYDPTYGPQDTQEEEGLDTAADLAGDAASLGAAYQGLRKSLYDSRSWPAPNAPDTAQDDPEALRAQPDKSGIAY